MDFSKKTIWIVWLSHNFENCPSMIFPSSCLSQPSSQWPAQAALMQISWKETIFKIMVIGRINVSICNVNFTYYFNIVFYIWHYAFEKNIIEYFGLFVTLGINR